MSTPTKLAGFALVLVAAFGVAVGLGNAVGPMKSGTSTAEHAGMNTAGGEAAAGPVTGYELTHDRELHLIAVRRHLAGFLHVHPRTSRGRHLEHPAGPDRRPMAAVHRSSRQAMTTNSEESR